MEGRLAGSLCLVGPLLQVQPGCLYVNVRPFWTVQGLGWLSNEQFSSWWHQNMRHRPEMPQSWQMFPKSAGNSMPNTHHSMQSVVNGTAYHTLPEGLCIHFRMNSCRARIFFRAEAIPIKIKSASYNCLVRGCRYLEIGRGRRVRGQWVE